jgi:hypothetical protein
MSLRKICRMLVVSVLVATFGLSLPLRVEAAGVSAWGRGPESPWSQAWEWLAWLWVGEEGVASVEKQGPGLDPDGRNSSESEPQSLDPESQTEQGPGLDPDGKL